MVSAVRRAASRARLPRRPAGHEHVQVALRPRDGTDRRLDHDDGIGRVGNAVLLGDGTELQLQADGQVDPSRTAARSVGGSRGGPRAALSRQAETDDSQSPDDPPAGGPAGWARGGHARLGDARAATSVTRGRVWWCSDTRQAGRPLPVGPPRRSAAPCAEAPPGAPANAASSSIARNRSSDATIGSSASTTIASGLQAHEPACTRRPAARARR